jgi:aminopeptidase N
VSRVAAQAALPDCRLPRYATPSHYDVHLTPDLAAFTFGGVCRVTFTQTEPANTLVRRASTAVDRMC